jgi:hypothetical protein
VDELHLIENKRDIVAIILLTLATGGVKTHSFLDEFQGFRSQAASFLNAQAGRITGKSGDLKRGHCPVLTAQGRAPATVVAS